jgi:LysM repeat protein
MASTIGIKIANGEFHPIMEEKSSVTKRLVLTTVHDAQKSVQIDLYKSLIKTMADAQYIGSLVIEEISPKPKGAPSVELTITSNPSGEISADAVDLDAQKGGEHYHLNISLASFEEDGQDITIPDFELESYAAPPKELYEDHASVPERDFRRPLPLLLMLIVGGVVLVVLLAGIWVFLNWGPSQIVSIFGFGKPAVENPAPEPSVVEAAPVPVEPPIPVEAATPPAPAPVPVEITPIPEPSVTTPVIEAPVAPTPASPARSRERTLAPVTQYKVPTTIPRGGVPYKIQWGDTLWEISEAFYRNPWLYSRIARFNNIRDPNRIISGTTIRIPPRN